MLDFAKVERGKAAYEFASGQVEEVVARAVDVFRYRAEREGMDVRLRIEEGLPPASIDDRAVELAVINLLDNAFKYAKEGGRIDVDVTRAARLVRVRVSDRGPGIDPEDRARIFGTLRARPDLGGDARARQRHRPLAGEAHRREPRRLDHGDEPDHRRRARLRLRALDPRRSRRAALLPSPSATATLPPEGDAASPGPKVA